MGHSHLKPYQKQPDPTIESHRRSLTVKGLLDLRLYYPKLLDHLCTDEELYQHIKYFYSFPTGAPDLGMDDVDYLNLLTLYKANGRHVCTLTIAFKDGGYRIPAFIANYKAWQRRGKIDKLLY